MEWNELSNEEAYRAKLREEAEGKDGNVSWDDNTERDFRRKYVELR